MLKTVRHYVPLVSLAAVLVSTLQPSTAGAAAYTPGQTYFSASGFVEYMAGDLPLILSVPHGGELQPVDIPDRTMAVVVNDPLNQECARAVADAIRDITGHHPHLILNRLHRSKLDANRDLVSGAQGNPLAEQVWSEFHAFIDLASVETYAQCGGGHYFDLHSNGRGEWPVEFGYLLGPDELKYSDESLSHGGHRDGSSLRSVASQPGADFAELLRGETSLGGLLQARGYRALPSPSMPYPEQEPYYSGGYNVLQHGSRSGGWLDATQVDVPYDYLLEAKRDRFVRSLAEVMVSFMEEHYGFNLRGDAARPVCGLYEDVPFDYWASEQIEGLTEAGYMEGCATRPSRFCPEAWLSRADLAVVAEKGLHGPEFVPQESEAQTYGDVPSTMPQAPWITAFADDGLAQGCSSYPPAFCPEVPTSRIEAAITFLRLRKGAGYVPPQAQDLFRDMPSSEWRASWAEAAYREGLMDRCQGGSEPKFCPFAPITRAMAADMLAWTLAPQQAEPAGRDPEELASHDPQVPRNR